MHTTTWEVPRQRHGCGGDPEEPGPDESGSGLGEGARRRGRAVVARRAVGHRGRQVAGEPQRS